MRHYTRTLIIVAISISLLLVMLLAGCRQSCQVEQSKPEFVGGGSIDNATGRVTIQGCVETKAVEK